VRTQTCPLSWFSRRSPRDGRPQAWETCFVRPEFSRLRVCSTTIPVANGGGTPINAPRRARSNSAWVEPTNDRGVRQEGSFTPSLGSSTTRKKEWGAPAMVSIGADPNLSAFAIGMYLQVLWLSGSVKTCSPRLATPKTPVRSTSGAGSERRTVIESSSFPGWSWRSMR
jgi:hypothetical protein